MKNDGQWLREPVGEIMAFPNREDPSEQVDKPLISTIVPKIKHAPKMKTVKI